MKITVTKEINTGENTVVKGKISCYTWCAIVSSKEVDNAISPRTLLKGKGKIIALRMYDAKNQLAVEYNFGWITLRYSFIDIVEKLVEYIERRYSFKVIQGGIIWTES